MSNNWEFAEIPLRDETKPVWEQQPDWAQVLMRGDDTVIAEIVDDDTVMITTSPAVGWRSERATVFQGHDEMMIVALPARWVGLVRFPDWLTEGIALAFQHGNSALAAQYVDMAITEGVL